MILHYCPEHLIPMLTLGPRSYRSPNLVGFANVEKFGVKSPCVQVEIIIEKLEKFGVHRYIPQNTADDRYQGGGADSDPPWSR